MEYCEFEGRFVTGYDLTLFEFKGLYDLDYKTFDNIEYFDNKRKAWNDFNDSDFYQLLELTNETNDLKVEFDGFLPSGIYDVTNSEITYEILSEILEKKGIDVDKELRFGETFDGLIEEIINYLDDEFIYWEIITSILNPRWCNTYDELYTYLEKLNNYYNMENKDDIKDTVKYVFDLDKEIDKIMKEKESTEATEATEATTA